MYWNPLYSHPEAERKKAGTAMLSEPDLLTSMRIISVNASCKVVEINGTKVAFISAYFPPGNERSRSTVIAVENIMEKLKGLPTILAADFNSIPRRNGTTIKGICRRQRTRLDKSFKSSCIGGGGETC